MTSRYKISAIITSYKEPETIGRAIDAFLDQKEDLFEIIVTAPDYETLSVAKKYQKRGSKIKIIKDAGIGKPAAMNMVVKKAKGDILIFTDGDVYVSKNAVADIVSKFSNPSVGAVSGRPVSVDSKNKMLGFWAYVLTDIANEVRIDAVKNKEKFFCSGYLFGIRKNLFPKLDKELLSEDGYISLAVYKSRHTIEYCKEAEVYVKYPTTFSDWIKQKKRSAGGYNQIKKMTGVNLRSFGKESKGVLRILRYVTGIREFFWTALLVLARMYLWIKIYLDINIRKLDSRKIWQRVESTK